jgi:hypothetical protein
MITLIASSSFSLARLASTAWDPSVFVSAGEASVPQGSPGLTVRDPVGYDGQFFFRLSRNPFTTKRSEFGIKFDGAPLRQQRIFYPFLVWILSGGGKPTAVLWLLITVNIGALTLAAWSGSIIAEDLGRSPFVGLLFAAIPGLLIGLTFDTAEPLAIALGVSALALLRRDRFAWAAAALATAALTRETTLLFTLGVLVAIMWKKGDYLLNGRRAPLWIPVMPLSVFAAFQVYLWVHWGRPGPLNTGKGDLGVPILGMVHGFTQWATRPLSIRFDNVAFAALSVLVLMSGAMSFRHSAALLHERLAFIASLLLVLCLQSPIWFHYASFLRALSESVALGLIMILGDARRTLVGTSAAATAVWGYLGVRARLLD